MIAVTADDDSANDAAASLLALIWASPGNVSPMSMMTEVAKHQAVRGLAMPAGLFTDVAPKVLEEWRATATVEGPSHLRC